MKVLVILPSLTYSNDYNNIGIKAKIVNEIWQRFEKLNYDMCIATFSAKQPIINTYKDEQLKKWASNYFNNAKIYDINQIASQDFEAILIPNFITIYTELNKCLINLIYDFCNSNKLICAIGHGVYALTQYNSESWPLLQYRLTGPSIDNFIQDDIFVETDMSIEEIITLQGGIYIEPNSSSENEVLIVEDRNIITAYDDNSFTKALDTFTTKLSKSKHN